MSKHPAPVRTNDPLVALSAVASATALLFGSCIAAGAARAQTVPAPDGGASAPAAAVPAAPAASAAAPPPAAAPAASPPAAPAAAKPADAPDSPVALEQVVITSRLRAEPAQKSPLAVTAVPASVLEARSASSVLDVAKSAPNVNIQQASAGFGAAATATIRGVGQFDTNLGLEPGVGIYIDDVYFPTLFGSVFDLLDIDRVEVLRGPQGTLAGKNSIGGAIKLYSRRPNGDDGGSVSVTAGSFNRMDSRASAGFAIKPDVASARIAMVSKSRDGYLTRYDYNCRNGIAPTTTAPSAAITPDCKLGTEGGIDFKGIRGALRLTPTKDLDINVIADTSKDRSEPAATRLLFVRPGTSSAQLNYQRYITPEGDGYANYSTYDNVTHQATGSRFTATPNYSLPVQNDIAQRGLSATVEYQFNDELSLMSITAHRKLDGNFSSDGDGGPDSIFTTFNTFDNSYWTQELRLNGSLLDKAFDYTLGAYYFDAEGAQGGRVDAGYNYGFGPNAIPLKQDFTQNDTVLSRSKAVFVNTTYHVLPEMNVSLGLRRTSDRKQYTFGRYNIDGTPNPLDGATSTYSGARTDYRVSLDYAFQPTLLSYVSYATGQKGGGVNPRPFVLAQPRPATPPGPPAGPTAQVVPFNPEVVNALELGFKWDGLDRTLRVNGAAFYNKYKDILINISTGFPVTGRDNPSAVPVNAGEATVKGVELEVAWRPVTGLRFDLSGGYTKFRYTELSAQAVASGVRTDMVNPFTPKANAAVGVQYDITSAVTGLGGTLTPRLDYTRQTAFYANAINAGTNAVSGRELFNARLGWASQDGNWQAALAVTNLMNKYYYANKLDVTTGVLRGQVFGTVGAPREYALTVKRVF